MRRLRVYVDTSVVGGCFDSEFAAETERFLGLVRQGRVVILISDVVIDELRGAPEQVRGLLASLPPKAVARVELTAEVIELRDAYLAAGIVTRDYADDATHVAAATAARADAIASWNFRHIVRLDKMKAYNRVNIENGFGILSIVSPREVRLDDDDQE